ncbi:hypothetical protein ACFO3J_34000 [Streptomyces polygonati]|uniref:Gram-positive cocci surface proteins LPxTG domain-containing protein n=1 Tax=Streptomyces polygonati TaxID=1617087 RepID=A0ABV8HZ91_9ACTN
MFGLRAPALAAAGVAALLAVAGMSAVAAGGPAVADEGGVPGTPGTSAAPGALRVTPRTVAPGGVVGLRLATSCQVGQQVRAGAEAFVNAVTLAPAADGRGLAGSAFIKSDATDGSYPIAVDCDGVTDPAEASVTVTAGSPAGADGPATPPDQSLTPDQTLDPTPDQALDQASEPASDQPLDQPRIPDQPQAQDESEFADQARVPDQPELQDPAPASARAQPQDHLQTPVRPVPAGGGGTAQLAAGPAASGTSVGPLLATGGFAAAGLAGLVVHRRRTAARG